MRLNRLETHDRYEHFTKGEFDIGETCQNIIDQKPFGDVPFYIFAHQRTIGTDERVSLYNQDLQDSLMVPGYIRKYTHLEQVPSARLIWQPRLTKPRAQDNSMLFRVAGSDAVEVIWIIPQKELWANYYNDQMTAQSTIAESIADFIHDRAKLESKHPGDLNDEQIDRIYANMSKSAKYQMV